MTGIAKDMRLVFEPLRIEDREEVQRVTLHAGRRNCNLTFANLIGWQFLFDTERCLLGDTVIVRYFFDHRYPVYFVCSAEMPERGLFDALLAEAKRTGHDLTLTAVEDSWAARIGKWYPEARVESVRDSFDYIYLREELQLLRGGELKAKRNHVNRFRSEHRGFEFRPLGNESFDACRQLADRWRTEVHHDNPWYGNTLESERQMMERVFAHWDRLGMLGGGIWTGGRLVAFSFGARVTVDTFDTCIEKADRTVDGAFNIINQQMAAHLPEEIRYINREEDMGLPGLRKAKSSYHPYMLLSYNRITIPRR